MRVPNPVLETERRSANGAVLLSSPSRCQPEAPALSRKRQNGRDTIDTQGSTGTRHASLNAAAPSPQTSTALRVFFLEPLHLLSTKTPLQFVCTTTSSTRQSCLPATRLSPARLAGLSWRWQWHNSPACRLQKPLCESISEGVLFIIISLGQTQVVVGPRLPAFG